MAWRTTAEVVRDVLGADYDAGDANTPARSLTPFLAVANLMTSRVEAAYAAKAIAPLTGELAVIESQLAAHAYSQSDRPYASTTVLNASATFQGKTGLGFDSSGYGQTAKGLDRSGLLAAIDAGGGQVRTAGVKWGGKTQAEMIPFEQRG